MRKQAKRLFQKLGALRDVHVMEGWIEKLGAADDPVRQALEAELVKREKRCRRQAEKALEEFDRKKWKRWIRVLAPRSERVPLDSREFERIALDRWQEAYEFHRRALRRSTPGALHRLRIGLKRFRYAVENFLPQRHAAWGEQLKQFQDWLGEVHDLDVLRETARKTGAFSDPALRSKWEEKISAERQQRIDRYISATAGRDSVWLVWRNGLIRAEPSGAEKTAKTAAA